MEAALSERFNQNLQQFARQQPQVAMRLAEMAQPRAASRAEQSSKLRHWFRQIPLAGVKVLYVYGIGNGEAYAHIAQWLHDQRDRALVFLEDDLAALRDFLGSETAEKILSDPQARIYRFQSPSEDDLLFNNLAWDYNLKPFYVVADASYATARAEKFAELHDRLIYEHHCKGEFAQEYLDQGIVFYQNFYANILRLHTCYLGDALFGQFKDIPAIICGAGPSLQKQIPLLGTLREKALIFAGGSALNALSHAGVLPHFSCGIDPNSTQLQRLRTHSGYEVPFFFRSRMHHRAFQTIHGPRLYVTGTGGYETAQYFEERLGLPTSELDEGHNVVNFSLSLAHAMGCHPIIFVGLDLAYTEMRAYAHGVVPDSSVTVQSITQQGIDHAAIMRKDIYGRPVYTLWKWINESHWIHDYATSHPDIELINATEGGIGIEGVANLTLASVVENKLNDAWDLEGKVWGSIQEAPLPKGTQRKVKGAMAELRASLVRAQEFINRFLELSKTGTLTSGMQALIETELEQEVAFQYLLCTFSAFSERMQSYQRRCLAWISPPGQQNRKVQHAIAVLQRRHYTFLRKVVKSNLALIDYSLHRSTGQKALPLPRSGKTGSGKKSLKIESPNRAGHLHGRSRVWDQTGVLLSETDFKQGQRDGICRRYYSNEQLYMDANYSKGKLVGIQRYFYPNGRPKTVIDSQTRKTTLY